MSETKQVTIWVAATYYDGEVGSIVALTKKELHKKAVSWASDDLPFDEPEITGPFNDFVEEEDYLEALRYWANWISEVGMSSYLEIDSHTLTVPAGSKDWWDVWLVE